MSGASNAAVNHVCFAGGCGLLNTGMGAYALRVASPQNRRRCVKAWARTYWRGWYPASLNIWLLLKVGMPISPTVLDCKLLFNPSFPFIFHVLFHVILHDNP